MPLIRFSIGFIIQKKKNAKQNPRFPCVEDGSSPLNGPGSTSFEEKLRSFQRHFEEKARKLVPVNSDQEPRGFPSSPMQMSNEVCVKP